MYLNAGALENIGNRAASRAIHRIHYHALLRISDHVKVDQSAHMVGIIRDGIETLDQVQVLGLAHVHQIRTTALRFIIIQVHFHFTTLLGQGRAASPRLELNAVIAGALCEAVITIPAIAFK